MSRRLVEFRGERRTLAEWARVLGLSANALQLRLRAGWPVDKAMLTPARPTNIVRRLGMASTSPEFCRITHSSWASMHARCSYPNARNYDIYGGRGIRVCERWNTFANFIGDMGRRPSPGHSLDRVDNDGNYEPGNVRWATALEQTRNRSIARTVTVNGETLPVIEWARRNGLQYETVHYRLQKGWPAELAVTKPPFPVRKVSA